MSTKYLTEIDGNLLGLETGEVLTIKDGSAYNKPTNGIPKTDLTTDIQTSLGKADTALQTHQDISGKQDKLTAGTNITISDDNVISAEGGGGDTGVELTQEEFDALTEDEKNNGTTYYITNATPSTLNAEMVKYGSSNVKDKLDSLSSTMRGLLIKQVGGSATIDISAYSSRLLYVSVQVMQASSRMRAYDFVFVNYTSDATIDHTCGYGLTSSNNYCVVTTLNGKINIATVIENGTDVTNSAVLTVYCIG